jgi:predicted branched-subunit amino acid permease
MASRALFADSFLAGMRAVSPVVAGVIPFGLVYGITAAGIGLDPVRGTAMSVMVFAGASQLAAVQLMAEQAPLVVIAFTGLVVTLRFVMYSASLAPHFRSLSTPAKLGLAYLLVDQSYAMSIVRFEGRGSGQDTGGKVAFYLGTGVLMWLAWQPSCLAGVVLGERLPESWNLSFAVPLTFMALLAPALKDRPALAAGIIAGAAACVFAFLPMGANLLVGAVSGIVSGMYFESRKERP